MRSRKARGSSLPTNKGVLRPIHTPYGDDLSKLAEDLSPSQQQTITDWLNKYEVQFNSFGFTESERDRHLDNYYIEHKAFRENKDLSHALIYAAPGEGKTATRLRLQSHFNHRFAVDKVFAFSHVISEVNAAHPPDSLNGHIRDILTSAVQQAFILLAQFGHELPKLTEDLAIGKRLAWFFDACYPTTTWRDDLRAAIKSRSLRESLTHLGILFDEYASPAAPGTVNAQWLRDWLRSLPKSSPISNGADSPHSALDFDRWVEFRDLLFSAGVSAIVALVDGVDAKPGDNPAVNITRVAYPLAKAMEEGALGNNVYVKLFLPRQIFVPLSRRLREGLPTHIISWERDDLVKLINARLSAASDGAVGSLRELAEPNVTWLENYLIEEAHHSPRVLAHVLNQLLAQHVEPKVRGGSLPGRISRDTLDKFYQALEQVKKESREQRQSAQ